MMDTKTLVVGQDVSLNAGVYSLDGKVVKIRWWGVYVQIGGRGELIRFAKEGKECGVHPLSLIGPMYIDGTLTERKATDRRETKWTKTSSSSCGSW